MTKALTLGLQAALTQYLNARKNPSNIAEVLTLVVAEIGNQSPAAIANADSEIANAAGLSWWQNEQPTLRSIFHPQVSDSQLLLKTPGLEYLYIFHRNGRIREQALNRTHGPLPNSFILAAVVWRLNDWVSQVRNSAVICANRCFDKTGPNVWARFFLSTWYQQKSWGRWGETERTLVTGQLRRTDVVAELVKLLLTERAGPLPSALAHVIQFPEIDCHLDLLAEKALNPGVRAIALRALIESEAKFSNETQWRWIDKPMGRRRKEPRIETRQVTVTSNREELYRLGLADKSSVVRRTALSGIIKFDRHHQFSQNLAREFVADLSASVRTRAKFIVDTPSTK
jgi:hypothetical protein